MSRKNGLIYESLAAKYLQQQGLKLIEKNFHAYQGELDLIMMDKKDLVFVEVKFRKSSKYGTAAEMVNYKKQQHLAHAAQFFLQSRKQYNNYPCRFDVIAISGDQHQQEKQPKIDWIKNAFLIT